LRRAGAGQSEDVDRGGWIIALIAIAIVAAIAIAWGRRR
jgi:hypothetical protein